MPVESILLRIHNICTLSSYLQGAQKAQGEEADTDKIIIHSVSWVARLYLYYVLIGDSKCVLDKKKIQKDS